MLRSVSAQYRRQGQRKVARQLNLNVDLFQAPAPRTLLPSGYHYDYIVIGGGSGGLASAREAAKSGAKTLVLDFVEPSQHGSSWGLGGTCVNVGCIPKKIMHHAALLRKDAQRQGETLLGDRTQPNEDAWQHLVSRVQDHIKASNYGYRTALRAEGVDYENARGALTAPHTVTLTHGDGRTEEVSARHVLVAVGGRPTLPAIPGSELCVTSDDLFSTPRDPGAVVCLGASYVSLECAGLLAALATGPVTVVMRSVPLRGFDAEMAEKVVSRLETAGVRVLRGSEPLSVRRCDDGRLEVLLRSAADAEPIVVPADTVLAATGRRVVSAGVGLDAVGATVEDRTRRIVTDDDDAAVGFDWLHAIGDCAAGRPELTPVAAMAGRKLARRLFAGSCSRMDYATVPTTVFTPTEYACVGDTEAEAEAAVGTAGVEVFHAAYDTLEDTAGRTAGAGDEPRCYIKAICDRPTGRIRGLHILGPQAGEVLQGFAVAMRLGATMADLADTVGIHPTHAEEVVGMTASKQNGEAFVKTSC